MKTKFFALFAAALLLVGVLVSALSYHSNVTAAPVAGPTPITVPGLTSASFNTVVLFDAVRMTADRTSQCVDAAAYSVADVQYQIIQGSPVNTTTLTIQYTNRGGLRANGPNVVANNAQTATDMQQVPVFGRQICVLANVANSQPVTITVDMTLR